MRIVSFDTETYLIKDRATLKHGNMEVKLEPYETPKAVLGSYAVGRTGFNRPQECAVVSLAELRDRLYDWLLMESALVVGHNLAFDIDVIATEYPDLRAYFEIAAKHGRLLDTKILDVLLRIGKGYFDTPQQALGWGKPPIASRSLKDLYMAYCGKDLAKDGLDADGDNIRLSFRKYDGIAVSLIPECARRYALEDAVATWEVFWTQLSAYDGVIPKQASIDTNMSFIVHTMDKKGVHINKAEAKRLHDIFQADIPTLQEQVVAEGYASWRKDTGVTAVKATKEEAGPPTPWVRDGSVMKCVRHYADHARVSTAPIKFVLNQNAIRKTLQFIAEAQGLTLADLKMTGTGLLSASVDEWVDRIPHGHGLQKWTRYAKLEKILSTYLRLYAQVDKVYPRWNTIGAVTGRMSATSPSVMNVPKRKWGIRSLFVPAPGKVFVISDYCFQELVTLAQAMKDIGIQGKLFEAIQSGDPHTATARLLLNKQDVTKEDRQAAKAVNFGVPGGLGPAKLADYARKNYGQMWTVEQAAQMRNRFLEVYPDIQEYLDYHKRNFREDLIACSGHSLEHWMNYTGAKNMRDLRKAMASSPEPFVRRALFSAERRLSVKTSTGFTRGCCRFTEASNCRFQSLAAAVTKRACFLLSMEGHVPTLVVHDEIVTETIPESAEYIKTIHRCCMLSAFLDICPSAGQYAKVESHIANRWGPATDADGKEI